MRLALFREKLKQTEEESVKSKDPELIFAAEHMLNREDSRQVHKTMEVENIGKLAGRLLEEVCY